MFLDLTEVVADGEPIPNGEYNVVCETAELRDTKAGTGQYINLKFKVESFSYKGAVIYTMLNIKNPNEQAVKIGMGQLKRFMSVAGHGEILQELGDLEGLRCRVKTNIKTDSFGEKVNITSYSKYEGDIPTDSVIVASDPMNVPF